MSKNSVYKSHHSVTVNSLKFIKNNFCGLLNFYRTFPRQTFMEIKRKSYREQCEEFSSNVKNEMLDKYNSWHSLFKRAEPYKYLILNRRHAEHYTDQGPVVGRLFTELNTANQPSETDQSVLGSDQLIFSLKDWDDFYHRNWDEHDDQTEGERLSMSHNRATLYRVAHDADDSKYIQMNTMNLNRWTEKNQRQISFMSCLFIVSSCL